MTGVDPIYFTMMRESEISPATRKKPIGQRSLEEVVDRFTGEIEKGRVCISLRDVYSVLNGEATREKEKAELFLNSNLIDGLDENTVETSSEFLAYLTQLKNLENLCRQEKLVAYYLLDTDEEKFALFFERSNSKGIQLNFIDILAAKLYSGFNLRQKIEEFEDASGGLELNREVLTRAICFHVSEGNELGRTYILSKLTHAHFNEHWDTYIKVYESVYDFLQTTRLIIHPAWLPYENMVLPLMAFAARMARPDFSQISANQARLIRSWYWLAIFSRRYSSAAQTFALEDARALDKLAQGDSGPLITVISRMQAAIRGPDDLSAVHKKFDAVYKGVLNLVNFSTGGFLSFENGNLVSSASNLEDHHVFPKDYLRKNWASVNTNLDQNIAIDCVVNRTLIPKLTNIKVGNKSPSKYLSEIKSTKNSSLSLALRSHLLEDDQLINGDLDNEYELFLISRAEKIYDLIETHVIDERTSILREFLIDEAARGHLIKKN